MVIEVVDTNVWTMMDKLSPPTTAERDCVRACLEWGAAFSRGSDDYKLAADMAWKILSEYRRNIKPGGLAEQYLNKLLSQPITRLKLVEVEYDANGYAILPENMQIADKADRKFVAVALAFHPPIPLINATDTDWAQSKSALIQAGIPLIELCSGYIEDKLGQ